MKGRDARSPLSDLVAELPTGPGVYRWRDAQGRVLYVGKASNLRARTRSYLSNKEARGLTHLLMRRAVSVDVVQTHTPEEALLLENTLIKQEQPPYNLRLKDDKAYLLVRVDRKEAWPRLRLVRAVRRDGATYIGPFAGAKGLRRTLRFLRTLFPLRTCSDRELRERSTPCLYHQLGRCAAPCVDKVDAETYAAHVRGTLAVLRGRDDGLLRSLRRDMAAASEAMDYERAALLRDRAAALEASMARQETVSPDGKDRDVIAVARAPGLAVVSLVYVRDGHVVAARTWPERNDVPRGELLHALLARFYARGKIVPPEILVEEAPADLEGVEEVLAAQRAAPVRVRVPQRGPSKRLLALAAKNGQQALLDLRTRARDAHGALVRLAEILQLDAPPGRIEGYDVAHLQGSDPVAAMSVLLSGVPDTTAYRHFSLREAPGGDDFAGMEEVLRRRFKAGAALGDTPDLVMIDGGRGQVEAAHRALERVGLPTLPIVGLAKARSSGEARSDERLVVRGQAAPILLPEDDPGLRLLVKLRDEAHRFAGRHLAVRRRKRVVSSALDGVPGIGPARRRRLLKHFGSVEGILRAPVEDLAALPGIGASLAQRIRRVLGDASARSQ